MALDYTSACGGGGFLGCSNPVEVQLDDRRGGGWFGNLCGVCAERLERHLQKNMQANWKRYRKEIEEAKGHRRDYDCGTNTNCGRDDCVAHGGHWGDS